MKRKRVVSRRSFGQLLIALASALTFTITAQNTIPVVTIRATDPGATWEGDPGAFTLFRQGDASQDLNVYCRIFGTATNGVDYQTIGNLIQIPSGTYSNTVTLAPINKGQTVIKFVTMVLSPSPMMPPVNYTIGSPSNATVFISPLKTTNFPPVVRIAFPNDGAKFYTPTNIGICAGAFDSDGYVATVEFFAGANSLGVRTNNPWSAGPANPFCLIWSNPPAGSYVLTALATDNDGATALSAPVNIEVLPGPPPPPTNVPPVVRLTSPPNGAIFYAPVRIPLYAYAADRDDAVASVEFFAGTNSLGLGQGLCLTPALTNWPGFKCPTNAFVLVWSNAPAGAWSLTAVATDSQGASAVSPAVKITVLRAPPPPTNRPPIVSIVAADPIAIEGTNCWPWLGLSGPAANWSNWVSTGSVWRFFTNCGPKNATFAVRRYGATNDDLTVTYDIGGSATNGVDYAPLLGSVTIPAGERRAAITVVPLDDGPPDINSTVVLKLLPDTNYIVGFPARAAALILDSDRPNPVTGLLPGNCFQLSAPGPDGAWFHIEASTDLANWTPVCTNQVVDGMINFIDPDAVTGPAKFYRAVPDVGPPAE